MNKAVLDELFRLTPAERMDLACDLWDSVPPADWPPVPDEQIREAEHRLDAHRRDPSRATPWQDAMERIRARFT
jgi:putative addiction module component (TIGR02574 family)